MSNYVHLIGAEQVQRAAVTMSRAAETWLRGAQSVDETLTQNQRWMDDWLTRFEAAVNRAIEATKQGQETS